MIFTVYSKDGCSYCEKFKSILQLEELKHVVYTLDQHFTKKQFYDEFGEGATFPQVVMDGIQLGGCAESLMYMQDKEICCTV